MSKYLRRAQEVAGNGFGSNKHGAIVVKNGKIVSTGVNIRTGLSASYSEGSWRGSHLHAEIVAIRIAGARANGATIYVARVNAAGEPMFSAPCARCLGAIRRAGVKKIVHT